MTKKQGAKALVRATAEANGTSYTTAFRGTDRSWLDGIVRRAIADGVRNIGLRFDADRAHLTTTFSVAGRHTPVVNVRGSQLEKVIVELGQRANINVRQFLLSTETRLTFDLNDQKYRARCTGLRTEGDGLLVTIRLPETRTPLTLHQLGMPDIIRDAARAALRRPRGLIIVAGRTGAGKTTTAYAALTDLAADGQHAIWSMEEPIEALIPGVTQIEIDEDGGGPSFRTAFNTLMGVPADLGFIGDMHGVERSQLCTWNARLRLSLTTIHAYDSLSALISAFHQGGTEVLDEATLVIAQRMVGRQNPDWDGEDKRAQYLGHVPVFEMLEVTEQLIEAITDRRPIAELRAAAKITAFSEHGRELVGLGLLGDEDVRQEFGV